MKSDLKIENAVKQQKPKILLNTWHCLLYEASASHIKNISSLQSITVFVSNLRIVQTNSTLKDE